MPPVPERLDLKHEPERLDLKHEAGRLDLKHEPGRLDLKHEPERLDLKHEPERLDLKHEPERLDLKHEPERLDLKHEPERLDAFMARANTAYYATHDPFADFTTAPEIGQVFGELLGAWAAVTWQTMGAPDPVLLIEAGPGRGTLMADALRAVGRVAPAFRIACRVHFIETSQRLRTMQAAAVPDANWHAALAGVPPGPAILIANEFLDALPIRQFERRAGAWHERHVHDGGFVLHKAVRPPEPSVFAAPDTALQVANVSDGAQSNAEVPEGALAGGRFPGGPAPDGAVLEWSQAAEQWIDALGRRLAAQGGAALILDYGRDAPGFGDTLQALRQGRRADPLADPGHADLTAHVDFPAIARIAHAAGATVHGPVPQGAFLHALGLRVRTDRLAAANPACAGALRDAADRLASPARMGHLFKALCMTAPGTPPPPGFAA